MIPKKPQKIIKQVAEELDLPQSTIDDLVSFYYKEIRKNLSSLEHPKINLPGLGDFTILKKSVDKLINKYTNLSNTYAADSFNAYHNIKLAESKLERLAQARKNIETFAENKKRFKDEKESGKYMEE